MQCAASRRQTDEHLGLAIHTCAVHTPSLQGIHIRYGHEDGEEGLTNGRSKSRRTLSHAAIGDAVRVDDQVYIGDGDTAGAMFSEETGLALKPLQRAPKPP